LKANRPGKIDPTSQKVGRYDKNGAGRKKLTRRMEGVALVIFFTTDKIDPSNQPTAWNPKS
jgi:hypothetical protein